MSLADSIEVPILIEHGEDDPSVHVAQAKSTAAALRGTGKPVELVILEDEIHGAQGEKNRIAWWSRLAAFLDSCLSESASSVPASAS